MATSNRHRGWRWDAANSRLQMAFNGTDEAYVDASGITLASGNNVGMVSGTLDLQNGGTVTQATNKTTGVTLSTHSGQITTNNAALAAAAEATFTVTNTLVAAVDVVVVNVASGGTSGEYLAHCSALAAGSFDITLANMSASSASDAVVINFAVIKGASS
jgi:hypothetical protein